MSHVEEETAAPGVDGGAGPVDLSRGPLAGANAEPEISYPARRGQEAMKRLGRWLALRLQPLAQPEPLVTLLVVGVCVVFVFWQFQPSQLFRNTTISGGDTGAHVLLPWVALHQLLPDLRLTGWTSSNWDGFPAVTFYFPLPIYSIVALSKVIGYNVAFKLVTAAPMILMPVAGWLMGRLARAPFPVPAVLAVATLPFIFGGEYEIYGGNILSTLAGEFAFGWSLWFALVFIGLVIRGLQTGRYRAWAAVMFACSFMSHIDPAMFAVIGAIVLVGSYVVRTHDVRGAFWWSVPTLAVGGFVAAWWALPFYVRFPYVTNMGYQRITTYLNTLFPTSGTTNDTWLLILAGMGAVLCVSRRRRIGEFLCVMAVLAAIAFRFMPQSILWNARVLPFWFLTLYLLAGLAVAELYAIVAERSTGFMVTLRAALLPAPLVVLVAALIWVGFPLRILPGENANASGNYSFLGIPQSSASVIPSWITWNYSGYQAGCPADCAKSRWPEYEQIVSQLKKVSKTYGCGNVMWEYNSAMNDYGTPDALTILPYWTNGCMGSMEGLYYEASATTPFHFIDQSELSLQPSDPMVGIPYASSPNVQLGVQHLQMLGVKYYMALNTELQTQAAADPSLKLISRFGPFEVSYGTNPGGPSGNQEQYWDLYLVQGAPRVHALANQPVVMSGLNNSSQPTWLNVMTTWYDDPSAWDVYLAATGPSNWAHVAYGATNVPVKPEPTTKVTDIVEHNASISFNVSRLGVPVVVTISYFPNWHVSGANGVYRVSPNLMVVVPTSHHVSMSYGTTPVDYEGYVLTILALIGLVVLIRRPRANMASVRRPGLGKRTTPEFIQTPLGRHFKGFWAAKDVPPWPRPGEPGTAPSAEPGYYPAAEPGYSVPGEPGYSRERAGGLAGPGMAGYTGGNGHPDGPNGYAGGGGTPSGGEHGRWTGWDEPMPPGQGGAGAVGSPGPGASPPASPGPGASPPASPGPGASPPASPGPGASPPASPGPGASPPASSGPGGTEDEDDPAGPAPGAVTSESAGLPDWSAWTWQQPRPEGTPDQHEPGEPS